MEDDVYVRFNLASLPKVIERPQALRDNDHEGDG
jgi:hypothetical protein